MYGKTKFSVKQHQLCCNVDNSVNYTAKQNIGHRDDGTKHQTTCKCKSTVDKTLKNLMYWNLVLKQQKIPNLTMSQYSQKTHRLS